MYAIAGLDIKMSANHGHLPVWLVQFSSPRNYLNNLRNKHCFLHSNLSRKSLNINLLFLFNIVLYSELSNKLLLKRLCK